MTGERSRELIAPPQNGPRSGRRVHDSESFSNDVDRVAPPAGADLRSVLHQQASPPEGGPLPTLVDIQAVSIRSASRCARSVDSSLRIRSPTCVSVTSSDSIPTN